MSKYTDIRYVLGQPRSGTSAFQRALCQASGLKGVYEPLRYELHWGTNKLEGRVFYPKGHRRTHPLFQKSPDESYILKDILGHNLLNEIDAVLTDDLVRRSAPVFLFRDPLLATNSLKKAGWYSVPYFVESYERGYQLFTRLAQKNLPVSCVTHDEIISDKGPDIINHIISAWGFTPKDHNAGWSDHYLNHVFYEDEQKREIENSGSHSSLIASQGLTRRFNKSAQLVLTKQEIALTENKLRPLYQNIQQRSLALKM
jgi:hypothetical protein